MQILKDENGFITAYALVGNLVGGIEAPDPEDIPHFEENFASYVHKAGALLFDAAEQLRQKEAAFLAELRALREKECFSFVNRGQLWYATLTVKQLAELTAWYRAWLKVTETKTIPGKPEWLE